MAYCISTSLGGRWFFARDFTLLTVLLIELLILLKKLLSMDILWTAIELNGGAIAHLFRRDEGRTVWDLDVSRFRRGLFYGDMAFRTIMGAYFNIIYKLVSIVISGNVIII